jgi:hypothetical protein
MKRALVTLMLCAGVAAPVAALAQAAPPAATHMRPPPPSPSPEMRALMDKIHGVARAAAYAALTPGHASTVRSIAGQVAAKTIDFPTGVKQIDALITVAEAKAVWGAAEKSRQELFVAMRQSGVGPGPLGPGPMMHGGPPPAGPAGGTSTGNPGPQHMAGGMPGGPQRGGPMAWHGHGGPMHGRGHHHGPSASGYLIMVSMTPEQMRALMPAPRARSSATP